MKIYDLKMIKRISEVFGPEYGRAVELGILAAIVYVLWMVMTWEVYSFQALLVAIITPFWAAINKRLRDIQNGK